MNNNPVNPNRDQQELEERQKDAMDRMWKELNRIMQLPPEVMTETDKAFLRARQSYLSAGQRETYASVLSATPEEPTRKELEAQATDLGIENPSRFKSKDELKAAIEAAQ